MAGQALIDRGIERREAIMNFIVEFQKENGFPPTIQEIAERVGLASPNATRNHLQRLQHDGWIRLSPRKGRSIVLLKRWRRTDLEQKAS